MHDIPQQGGRNSINSSPTKQWFSYAQNIETYCGCFCFNNFLFKLVFVGLREDVAVISLG